MDEVEILQWLRDERPGNLEDVIASLRARPEREAESVLRRLSGHSDPVIRAWAASAAARAIPTRAYVLLEPLLDDRDPDVRSVAVEELRRVDPSTLERQLPRLLAKLHSEDIFEPVTALWTLAQLRAEDARADIQQIVEEPYEPFHARIAEIVLAVIDGDDEAIAARIAAHDHDAVPWLAHAGRMLGSQSVRRALEELERSAPDEECRRFCQRALDRWDESAA
jgi:HEAT repeat protein